MNNKTFYTAANQNIIAFCCLAFVFVVIVIAVVVINAWFRSFFLLLGVCIHNCSKTSHTSAAGHAHTHTHTVILWNNSKISVNFLTIHNDMRDYIFYFFRFRTNFSRHYSRMPEHLCVCNNLFYIIFLFSQLPQLIFTVRCITTHIHSLKWMTHYLNYYLNYNFPFMCTDLCSGCDRHKL